ncbi:transcriptional regulator, TetR family [Xylanimonas cellulosilytica DSM 15894]|uniref:Transcriptional regulator, TetR family n=1 Tax=Xylanimonas cellulosilytica (strain DSM 15894 / JCM 12276 / CECT 5975 / KCTC 9989 / LMG 20990 / NBRC 107835 / XIL07) TaxID=446471 RepID=D1BTK7_XYLCX|nr:TetR/AcrR family transcriptional regulator [Xylanimonas cellulosilytica]ACZ30986.1 transcriptional regulator, TetR family [Xylanimonas cellulosilytica DSM 15894]
MSERELSPTQQRTRAALIRAGIEVLSNDPSAPLGEVAARADVARSTLHRYFADKKALTDAVTEFVGAEHDAAVVRANLTEGTGLEAMRRLALELMDRLDVLAWIMGPAMMVGDLPDGGFDEIMSGEPDQAVLDAVARGIADGSIDAALSPQWCESMLWSVLFSANHAPAAAGMTTTEARTQALRSLLKAIAADPGAVR